MKKRTFILFVVIVAVCLTLCLASCDLFGGGGNNNNGGTNNGEKQTVTLDSIEVSMADTSRFKSYFSNGEITLPQGVRADFTERDFVVKGKYSDKKTKALTDFTIRTTRNSARSVTIEFVVGDNILKTLTVNMATEVLPNVVTEGLSFEYSGSEVNVLAGLKFADDSLVSSAMTNSTGKLKLNTNGTAETTATDAGEYSFSLVCEDGYIWMDNGTEVTELPITWRITPKVVTMPTVQGETSFVYDGSEKTLNLDMHGFGDVFDFVNGGVDTRKATRVGEYTCQVMIKEALQRNYAFPDVGDGINHSSGEALNVGGWSITPRLMAYPDLFDSTNVEDKDGTTYYHYDYTGEAIVLRTNAYESVIDVTVNDGNPIVDACQDSCYYIVSFGLKAELTAEADNYQWADGTALQTVSLYVVVDPIDYVMPQAVQEATIRAEGVYSAGGSYEFGAYGIDLTTDSRELLTQEGVLIDDVSAIVYADDEDFEAGVKTLKYTFTRSLNYKPQEVEIEVTVKKGTIVVENSSWSGEQNAEGYYDVGTGDFIYNGLAQKKTFNMPYYPADTIFAKVTYNVYYGTEEGVYGEEPVQSAVVLAEEFGDLAFPYESTTKNAGYYKTVAVIETVDPNYVIVDADGNEIVSAETTWAIKKATVTVYPAWRGTFSQGGSKYTYYTGVNKTVEYNIGDTVCYLEKYYDANVYGGIATENVDLDDYADIVYVETYVHSGNDWVEAGNTSAVGLYKTVMNVTLKEGLSANYNVSVNDYEWRIISNAIDASGMTWTNAGTYEYGMGKPELAGLPDGLSVYYDDGSYDIGSSIRYAEVSVDTGVDGYEGVTITKPATGWEYNEINGTEIHYYVMGNAEYTVIKKIITIDDFYLTVDGNKLDDPYEFVYDGDTHSVEIAYDGMENFGLSIIYDDTDYHFYLQDLGGGMWKDEFWESRPRFGEVGTYVLSGFIFVDQFHAPGDNFAFDETAEYVIEMEESYDRVALNDNEGEPRSLECVIVNVDDLAYKYRIDFSFTWSIVAE